MELFSERLRELRQERQEKQADVAKAIGVSTPGYAPYEKGREPPYRVLRSLARHYDVSADYLIGLIDTRKAEQADILSSTGLSVDALQQLIKMQETADDSYYKLMAINTLTEHADDSTLLESIYAYLLASFEFLNTEKPAKTVTPKDPRPKVRLAQVNAKRIVNIETITGTDMADLYLIKIQKALIALKDRIGSEDSG